MVRGARVPARTDQPRTAADRYAPSAERQRRGLEALVSLAHAAAARTRSGPGGPPPPAGGRVIVVIPAHNEAGTIGSTLRSLAAQTMAPDEMVVVCDNCTDDTAVVSRQAGADRVMTTVGNTAR